MKHKLQSSRPACDREAKRIHDIMVLAKRVDGLIPKICGFGDKLRTDSARAFWRSVR